MIAADPDLREAIQTAADALSQALELLPAVVRPTLRTVLVNVKVDETLVIALAERAQAEGITQKQASMRALAAAGVMALQLGALRDALIDAGARPDKAG